MGRLARALFIAAGGDGVAEDRAQANERRSNNWAEQTRARLYAAIDQPFRRWLRIIAPQTDKEAAEQKRDEWHMTAQRIALRLGDELVNQAGEAAFAGRMVRDKDGGQQYYAAPRAFVIFTNAVKKIYKEG